MHIKQYTLNNLPIHFLKLQWTAQGGNPPIVANDGPSFDLWTFLLVRGLAMRPVFGFPTDKTQPTGNWLTHWASIVIHWLDCVGQSSTPTWFLPQGPLGGPWVCLPKCFQPKHARTWSENLSHEFQRKWTCKTWRNMHRHTMSFQDKIIECHGRLTLKFHKTWHSVYIHHND